MTAAEIWGKRPFVKLHQIRIKRNFMLLFPFDGLSFIATVILFEKVSYSIRESPPAFQNWLDLPLRFKF